MSHVVRYAPRGKPEVVLEIDESRDPFELLAKIEEGLGLKRKPAEDWESVLEVRRARAQSETSKPQQTLATPPLHIPQGWNKQDMRRAFDAETRNRTNAHSKIRDTSIASYRKARVSGKLTAQQEHIVGWLRRQIGDATRQEIARGTGLGINAVCGRVNELLAPEVGVLRETRKRKCRVTGETANAVRLA